MDKSNWTDRLPGLMEGHTEAEPEGLWDAVQAGMKPRRRVAAGWWYAAGSLAAAAAVVLAVFLWKPFRQDVPPVPGNNLVASADSVSVIPADTLSVDENAPEPPSEAVSRPAVRYHHLVADIPVEPAETYPEPDEMHPESAETPVQEQNQSETQPDTTEMPAEGQNKPETHPELTPVQERWPDAAPSTRKKGGKVQLSVTSGGLLAQAGTLNRNGFGLPESSYTKGSADGAGTTALFRSVHRNKASSTEARHWQNFRVGLMANYAFSPRWSVETGVQYTSLQAQLNTESGNGNVVTDRRFNYLGIPLNVQYKPLELGEFSLYLSAGPMYEILVGSRERSQTFASGMLVYEEEPRSLGLRDNRWSVNAGVGLQWQPFSFGAFFIQPGVSWHIPGREDAPETFYTARPVAFDLVFGARFLLR